MHHLLWYFEHLLCAAPKNPQKMFGGYTATGVHSVPMSDSRWQSSNYLLVELRYKCFHPAAQVCFVLQRYITLYTR